MYEVPAHGDTNFYGHQVAFESGFTTQVLPHIVNFSLARSRSPPLMPPTHPPKNGKRALVTGITGQDGSYLAELLLSRGYEVYGIIRRTSSFNTSRIDHLYQDPHESDVRLRLLYADLSDGSALNQIIRSVRPDEVYNLGAQSHVRVSFDIPEYTSDVTGLGCIRLLEAIREADIDCRFYEAASSEMFGDAVESPQSETTRIDPRSPYGCAKALAYCATRSYRAAYGMFAVNGILFNHESPRRGETFVTRKITRAAGRIAVGLQDCLYLGNLSARRDWGFAGDYVLAMWQMLQTDAADDYVIATGETHSVREFCELAFELAGLPIEWRGSDLNETGITRDGQVRVRVDQRYFRPAEVTELRGDASRAKRALKWKPTVDFQQLVKLMVDFDLALAKSEAAKR
jgi:GDPmannose 4,6-dehydratase